MSLLPRSQCSDTSYHVHFGAGRLGLGLVLPIFLNLSRPIAVFQRPNCNSEWKVTHGAKQLRVIVNGKPIAELHCLTDTDSCERLEELLRDHKNLFVSTSRVDLLRMVLDQSTSFSTAVGPGTGCDQVVEGLSLTRFQKCCKVLAFENDAAAVESLAQRLYTISGGILRVIPVLCDRICMTRRICPDRLEVSCESYPGVAVCRDPDPCLFSDYHQHDCSSECIPQLIVTESEEEQKFFCRRKIMILNGLHMLMAMRIYGRLHQIGTPFSQWLGTDVLLFWAETIDFLDCLINARIEQLLDETPPSLLHRIYQTQDMRLIYRATKEYSNHVVQRVSQYHDSVGRLLNLADWKSVRTKYHIRFMELKDFVFAKHGKRSELQHTKSADCASATNNLQDSKKTITKLNQEFIAAFSAFASQQGNVNKDHFVRDVLAPMLADWTGGSSKQAPMPSPGDGRVRAAVA